MLRRCPISILTLFPRFSIVRPPFHSILGVTTISSPTPTMGTVSVDLTQEPKGFHKRVSSRISNGASASPKSTSPDSTPSPPVTRSISRANSVSPSKRPQRGWDEIDMPPALERRTRSEHYNSSSKRITRSSFARIRKMLPPSVNDEQRERALSFDTLLSDVSAFLQAEDESHEGGMSPLPKGFVASIAPATRCELCACWKVVLELWG